MTPVMPCQKENGQWHYDLDHQENARIILGVIVVEHHLPDVAHRVAEQPNGIANGGRQPKIATQPKT